LNQAYRKKNLALPSTLRPFAFHLQGLVLLVVGIFLIVLNVFFAPWAVRVRATLMDVFSPVLQAVGVPGEAIDHARQGWKDVAQARQENEELHRDIEDLKAWRDVATQYKQENRALKELLKYKDETTLSSLTARVIGRSGGDFANSVIITAGDRDGVFKDMVALDSEGVVGRVIEIGEWSARVLLLNDINFRLPVMIEENQQQAILAGEGDEGPPKLLYLPMENGVKPGMRVLTSGHGGIFPPYLPVGVVKAVQGRNVTVIPYARLDRLQILRLAKYELRGALPSEIKTPAPAPSVPKAPLAPPPAQAPAKFPAPAVRPISRPPLPAQLSTKPKEAR
jgi:rod shape-determining protein MreC